MKLTRKKTIKLCIELWTWLAKTGEEKESWPDWRNYGEKIENDCWFCHYQVQQNDKYTTTPWSNKDDLCRYCPLTSIGTGCQEVDSPFQKWIRVKAPFHRKKYAKLFLAQIKTIV